MVLQDKMIIVGLLMTLVACGQKGPLLLAETKTPVETVEQQADLPVEKSEKIPEKLVKQPEKNQQEQYQ